MRGFIVNDYDMPRLMGLALSRVQKSVEAGMPVIGSGDDDGEQVETKFPFDPQRCTKRDVARCLGVTLADIDTWIRRGCPHVTTGKVRAPLMLNLPQVFRWRYVYESHKRGGPNVGALAEKEVEVWNLELALEVGVEEAGRILGTT